MSEDKDEEMWWRWWLSLTDDDRDWLWSIEQSDEMEIDENEII